jgi:hypothetical protein
MEKIEIILSLLVFSLIAVFSFFRYHYYLKYIRSRKNLNYPNQIPISSNPPAPPRCFSEKNVYFCQQKRINALMSLANTANTLDQVSHFPQREKFIKCLESELELISEAQKKDL